MADANSRVTGALVACFWEYARMALPPERLDRLEAACRRAGWAGSNGRRGPGRAGQSEFCEAVRVAMRAEGKRFVRRAGYFAGSAVARSYVQASAHPSASAERMAGALAGAIRDAAVSVRVSPSGRVDLRVEAARAIEGPFIEYAAGFVRGSAVRLNEGARPPVKEKVASGGKVWSARVDFSGGASDRPTGGRRTPRR